MGGSSGVDVPPFLGFGQAVYVEIVVLPRSVFVVAYAL
jgi:hypothetical protein